MLSTCARLAAPLKPSLRLPLRCGVGQVGGAGLGQAHPDVAGSVVVLVAYGLKWSKIE
jgi:hypothetical protein